MIQVSLTLEYTRENLAALQTFLNATSAVNNIAPVQPAVETPAVTASKKTDAAPAKQTEKKPSAKGPDKTDVRALALKISKAGGRDALKEIFAKYGTDKLSGVPEDKYPDLMKDLEAVNAKE